MRRSNPKKVAVIWLGTMAMVLALFVTVVEIKSHQTFKITTNSNFVCMDSAVIDSLQESIAQSSTEILDVALVSTTQEPSEYDGRFIANITDTLNIRSEATKDSNIVGKLHKGNAGDIISQQDDWTQISSGSVTGYVLTEYIVTGVEAEALANEVGETIGTIQGDTVRIRKEATTASSVVGMLAKGQQVPAAEQENSSWVQVTLEDGTTGYVSAEFITVELKLGTAISIEEEQAQIRAQQEAEAAAQQQSVQSASNVIQTVNVEAIAATYDDSYLLACLVSMEAGNEPYEGQLAVANVVLNRLRSGRWGSSISSVIYAGGQFPSVNGSVMNGYLANGPRPVAQQAANDALAGTNNIGGYMNFCSTRYAGNYSDYTIIGNHCFH